MRKVLATAFVSLDGVMQAPGGPEEDPTGGFQFGGWTFNYWDDAIGQVMGGIFSQPYELLLGRKTYEIFAAHWPHAKDDPFAEALTNVRKYVATSSRAPLTWKMFQTFCILCHGADGEGDGRAAKIHNPKPANLTLSFLSDDQKEIIIRDGGASVGRSAVMPAWGEHLTDEQISDVIAFLRKINRRTKNP